MNLVPNPYLALVVVLAFVGNGFYWNHHGGKVADTAWTARIEKERADAAVAARKTEAMWQGVVNETDKNWRAKNTVSDQRLRIALDSLRDRPERPEGVSETPRTNCAGANGAELGRSHGELLARYAARAKRQDNALAACYTILDKVR